MFFDGIVEINSDTRSLMNIIKYFGNGLSFKMTLNDIDFWSSFMQECLSGVLSECYFLNLDVLLHHIQTFYRICGGPLFCVIIVIVNYGRLKNGYN